MTLFDRRSLTVAVCAAALACAARPATAQTATTPSSLVTPVTPERAEPDFSLVNLPTTRPLSLFSQNFHLTHRFLGNLRGNSFGDNLGSLFGIDNGAVIGLEYRIAPIKNVQAVIYRNSSDKTIQFTAQIDAIRQGDVMPASVALIGAVEGNKNFGLGSGGHDHTGSTEYKSPSVGAVLSRTFEERGAVYAVPMFVHKSLVNADGTSRDTFFVGFGARLKVMESTYLVGELTPRFGGYAPSKPEFAFGVEKRMGGHMFLLTLTNSYSTTFAQLARGGFPDTLYFGFNLGRKFLR